MIILMMLCIILILAVIFLILQNVYVQREIRELIIIYNKDVRQFNNDVANMTFRKKEDKT